MSYSNSNSNNYAPYYKHHNHAPVGNGDDRQNDRRDNSQPFYQQFNTKSSTYGTQAAPEQPATSPPPTKSYASNGPYQQHRAWTEDRIGQAGGTYTNAMQPGDMIGKNPKYSNNSSRSYVDTSASGSSSYASATLGKNTPITETSNTAGWQPITSTHKVSGGSLPPYSSNAISQPQPRSDGHGPNKTSQSQSDPQAPYAPSIAAQALDQAHWNNQQNGIYSSLNLSNTKPKRIPQDPAQEHHISSSHSAHRNKFAGQTGNRASHNRTSISTPQPKHGTLYRAWSPGPIPGRSSYLTENARQGGNSAQEQTYPAKVNDITQPPIQQTLNTNPDQTARSLERETEARNGHHPQYQQQPTNVSLSQVFNRYEHNIRKAEAKVKAARIEHEEAQRKTREETTVRAHERASQLTQAGAKAVREVSNQPEGDSSRERIEAELKAMIEKMREYKAKDPTVFSEVWEQFKKVQPPAPPRASSTTNGSQGATAPAATVTSTDMSLPDLPSQSPLTLPTALQAQVEYGPFDKNHERFPSGRQGRPRGEGQSNLHGSVAMRASIPPSSWPVPTTLAGPVPVPTVLDKSHSDRNRITTHQQLKAPGEAAMREATQTFHGNSIPEQVNESRVRISGPPPSHSPRQRPSRHPPPHQNDHTTSSPTTTWPENKKTEISNLARSALLALPANRYKDIKAAKIREMLDKHPSYTYLCEMLEQKGFVFDRRHFAQVLLGVVPACPNNSSAQAPSIETSSQQTGSISKDSRDGPPPPKADDRNGAKASLGPASEPPHTMNGLAQWQPQPQPQPQSQPQSYHRTHSLGSAQAPAMAHAGMEVLVAPSNQKATHSIPKANNQKHDTLVNRVHLGFGHSFPPLNPSNVAFSHSPLQPITVTTPLFSTKEQQARKRSFYEIVDLAQVSDDESDERHKRARLQELVDNEQNMPPSTDVNDESITPSELSSASRLAPKPSTRAPLPAENFDLSHFRASDVGISKRESLRSAPIVQPMDRNKARLRSGYNIKTLARDILISTGRHHNAAFLNWHLHPLRINFKQVNDTSDLSTFKWELIDPGGPGLGATKGHEADAGDKIDGEVHLAPPASTPRRRGRPPKSNPIQLSSSLGSVPLFYPNVSFTSGDRGGGALVPSRGTGRLLPTRINRKSAAQSRSPRGDRDPRVRGGSRIQPRKRSTSASAPLHSLNVISETNMDLSRFDAGADSTSAPALKPASAPARSTAQRPQTSAPPRFFAPPAFTPPHSSATVHSMSRPLPPPRSSLVSVQIAPPESTSVTSRAVRIPSNQPTPSVMQTAITPIKKRGRPPGSVGKSSALVFERAPIAFLGTTPKKRGRPPGSKTRTRTGSGIRTTMPDDGVRVMLQPRSPSTPISYVEPVPKQKKPDKRKKGASRQATEPKYQVFKCRWKACDAELHNLKTLCKHVNKVHSRTSHVEETEQGPATFECLWHGCGGRGKVLVVIGQLPPLPKPLSFPTKDLWQEHIETEHIQPTALELGDGPSTHPSDVEPSSYLSDPQGNQITPLARTHGPPDPLPPDAPLSSRRAYHKAHGNVTDEQKAAAIMASHDALKRAAAAGISGATTMGSVSVPVRMEEMEVVDSEDGRAEPRLRGSVDAQVHREGDVEVEDSAGQSDDSES